MSKPKKTIDSSETKLSVHLNPNVCVYVTAYSESTTLNSAQGRGQQHPHKISIKYTIPLSRFQFRNIPFNLKSVQADSQ